jgi:hypothetical protein
MITNGIHGHSRLPGRLISDEKKLFFHEPGLSSCIFCISIIIPEIISINQSNCCKMRPMIKKGKLPNPGLINNEVISLFI